LKKIKKDPSILKQLAEKREECYNNLLNGSIQIRSEEDFEFEEELRSNRIISHLIPAQPHSIGEIASLVKHDELDQRKQEAEEEEAQLESSKAEI
jgi:Coiled-coil domain containing 32